MAKNLKTPEIGDIQAHLNTAEIYRVDIDNDDDDKDDT